MKYSASPPNELRSNNDTSENNGNRNTNRNLIIPTHTFDDIVKVLCMFDECPELRIERQHFDECCIVCHRNVHRLCLNDLSDIEINKIEQFPCKKLQGGLS